MAKTTHYSKMCIPPDDLGRGPCNNGNRKETAVTWKTPKVREIPLGGEINSYACAGLKK